MNNIAIFASGSGTNAENIINYFENSPEVKISLVLTNNPAAGVIQRAEKKGVKCVVFSRTQFRDTTEVVEILIDSNIDYIVLAGFLWLVPSNIIKRWEGRIINVHPALLPLFGGKGMYGDNVHQAVIASGKRESGITIHKVNNIYDSGDIIAQFKVEVTDEDTAQTLAQKIHKLEYIHFPKTILNDIKNL